MLLRDPQAIRAACEHLAREPLLALDTETTGLDPLVDRVVLVGLTNGTDCVLCDVRGLPEATVAHALAPVLEGGPLKVMHHARFDLRMLRPFSARVEPVADTLLNELILENGRPDGPHGLAGLSQKYLGLPLDKTLAEGFTRVGAEPFTPAQCEYLRRDVLATLHVFLAQLPRLQAEGAQKVARLEALCVSAVADMEHRGVHVDAARWRKALHVSEEEEAEARGRLVREFRSVANVDLLGGLDLNFDSDPEVKEALGELGINLEHINIEDLRENGHPAALALADYREARKRVTTYGESFLQHVHPRTGRVHASFRQLGAATGRMSCERPNLQNIPKGSELRGCFVAPSGRALVTADYAACELRILAHLSQDPVFLRAFAHGEDVHASVASQVFGVPVSKHEHPELRERAKTISFGLIYGMGPGGLAARTGTTLPEAEALFRQYFARFPRIDATLRNLEQSARRNGYAQTVLGRRLYMDPAGWERSGGGLARIARNMPIQGTSADITKLAMAYLLRRLRDTDAFLVNCVHDELLVECPADASEATARAVKQEMERAMQVLVPGVPPLADVKSADTWAK